MLASALDRLLKQFAALFEASRPPDRHERWELPVLAALLVAGAIVRFWGLGSVGLHGDEKTMALATMHIVKEGTPLLPSGMFYPRGLVQLYLMAESVKLFGESEWAFRLPSALCGIALIALAWRLGRRFLTPIWNMAFVGSVAFLPDFIMDAQTARMYPFFITCVVGYLILLFEWERTARTGYLVAAVATLVGGMQFHTLSVFAAPLALFPGILHGDRRRFTQGLVAFAVIVLAFVGIDHFINHFYALRVPGYAGSPTPAGVKSTAVRLPIDWLGYAAALAGAGAFGVFLAWPKRASAAARGGALLIVAGLGFQFALWHHVGALLVLAGTVVLLRAGAITPARCVLLAALEIALVAMQLHALEAAGVESLRKALGSLTGRPSVWVYLQHAKYSAAASIVIGLGVLLAIGQLARGRRLPDYWLFFLIGVWLQLFLIGSFMWFVPPNYTEGALPASLLCAFAIAQSVMRRVAWGVPVAALACVAAANPVAVARTVNAGYKINPDHKGAAEYMHSLRLAPNDIVLAEDTQEQVYYFGRVDYWLVADYVAAQFVTLDHGEVRDIYTHCRVIGSGPELQALLADPGRGAIYVIGSGEEQEDGRRFARGPGISALLESGVFRVIYVGRDGLTKVWKAEARKAASAGS